MNIFHRLSPLSAISCKQIKQQLTVDCNVSVNNGLYWVKGMQECTQSYVPILVCIHTHEYVQLLRVHEQYLANSCYTNRFIVTCQKWMVGGGH